MKIISQIVERITLYDILGYLFPGVMVVFLSYIVEMYYGLNISCIVKLLRNEFGNMWVPFVVLNCYLIGVVVSEWTWGMSALKDMLCSVFTCRHATAIVDNLKIYITGDSTNQNLIKTFIEKSVDSRLKNTDNNLYQIVGTHKTNYVEKEWLYWRLVHASIQTNSDYNRLHDYKAMALLRRNLAMVFFIIAGEIWYKNGSVVPSRLTILVLATAIVLFARQYSLEKNIEAYELAWFLDLINNKENIKKSGSTT